MKVITSRSVYDKFEGQVLEALGHLEWEGIATNNVIIPHVKFRNLPNEHDILVLTDGRVYTLEAKQLAAGFYRGASGGAWEYRTEQSDWRPVQFLAHPLDVAFKKARVLESFVR